MHNRHKNFSLMDDGEVVGRAPGQGACIHTMKSGVLAVEDLVDEAFRHLRFDVRDEVDPLLIGEFENPGVQGQHREIVRDHLSAHCHLAVHGRHG